MALSLEPSDVFRARLCDVMPAEENLYVALSVLTVVLQRDDMVPVELVEVEVDGCVAATAAHIPLTLCDTQEHLYRYSAVVGFADPFGDATGQFQLPRRQPSGPCAPCLPCRARRERL